MSQAPKSKWAHLEEPKKTEIPRIRRSTKWLDLEEPKLSSPIQRDMAPTITSKWSHLESDTNTEIKASKYSHLESEISSVPRMIRNQWSELEDEEPRYNNNKASKYTSLETPEVISRGPRQVRSHGSIMDRQDPKHMIAQAAPSIILRKSVLAASLENAIISQKHENKGIPIVPSKSKTQNKKAQKTSLDDLDGDEEDRKAIAAVAKARLEAQIESDEDEDVEEDEDDRPLTKAERKAAKHEAKKKKMIAAGLGHMYDR